MSDDASTEVKVSVAPLPDGFQNECPVCHRFTAGTERTGGVMVNRCLSHSCTFWERVTEDHIPRMFTEAELRRIAREEAIKVSKTHKNGHPVLRGTLGPYDAGAPRR